MKHEDNGIHIMHSFNALCAENTRKLNVMQYILHTHTHQSPQLHIILLPIKQKPVVSDTDTML